MSIDIVLLALNLTSHPIAQLLILLRSVLMIPAAVSGESTTMYKLVSSANSRISEPIPFTMSFI